jgi:hypothetical protein
MDENPQKNPNEYRLTEDNNSKTIEYFTGTMKDELIAQNTICLKVKEIIYVPKTKSIFNRIKEGVTRVISNPVRVVYYRDSHDKINTISYYKDKPAIVKYDIKGSKQYTHDLEEGYPKCIGSNPRQTLL